MTNTEMPPMAPPEVEEQSRFEALRQQVAERAGNLVIRTQIAIYGAVESIAEKRLESAGDVMEKMDHKEALYSNTVPQVVRAINEVNADVTGRTHFENPEESAIQLDANGDIPEARSKAEKMMTARIYRSSDEANSEKDLYEKHGGQNKLFYDLEKKPKTKKLTTQPQRKETTAERLKRTTDYQGVETKKPKTKLPKRESPYHRRLRKDAISSERKRVRTNEQPFLRSWRVGTKAQRAGFEDGSLGMDVINSRRGRAIGRIKTNHERSEKFRRLRAEKIAELED